MTAIAPLCGATAGCIAFFYLTTENTEIIMTAEGRRLVTLQVCQITNFSNLTN